MIAFDAQRLERGFADLDAIPPALVPAVVTHPLGDLGARCRGIATLRASLLGGALPPADLEWPEAHLARPILDDLRMLGIARFCVEQPDLVDALLADVIEAVNGQHLAFETSVAERLAALEALERARAEEAERVASRKRKKARRVRDPGGARARLEARAREAARHERSTTPTGLDETWGERVRAWAAVHDVFGDLGQLLGRGWDLSRGFLQQTGWRDVQRIRRQLEALPDLRAVIQSLGRLQHRDDAASVAETVFEPVTRLEEERREIRTPYVPSEARGITRSDDVARMLPAEAALLGHPKLHLLWHARRAERALLTYRLEGLTIERHEVEVTHQQARTRERPRPERGPILVAVDTSGSMHGLPEQVAKALVLEALRTAHREKRACHLYLYSGPDEVEEQTLSLSPDGLGTLFAFLGQSFHGGTDVGAVVTAITERLQQAAWQKADVLMVTDGEFPVSRAVRAQADAAKARGARFHGVLVGGHGDTALRALCDPVHRFSAWQRLLGSD